MSRMLLLVLAACSVAPGGGGDPLTEIPPLPVQQGCGDVAMFAVSDDGAVQIRFTAEGPVTAAYAGTPETTFTLPDPAITLTLEQGRNLADGNCTDVMEFEDGEPVVKVDTTWTPISGTATLTVTTTGVDGGECNQPADAVLHLEGVVFESPDGDQLPLDTMDVAATVGWCAG